MSIRINCEANNTLSINQLTEFQGNLKSRDSEDISRIIKSIKKHGFCFPFFVWKDSGTNYVFDGHGRLSALRQIEASGEMIPDLPVVYVKAKDRAEAKELLLKLNSNFGKMTADSVIEFLSDVELDLNFDDLALPEGVLNLSLDIEEETEEDDSIPEEPEEEAISQPGEIYHLGNSFLMCGDSTNEEELARLMNGEEADLVITDPPYNVAYEGKTEEKLTIQNDSMDSESFKRFLIKAFTNLINFLKAGASFYIWYSDKETLNFWSSAKEAGLEISQNLIWNKSCLVLGRKDYHWKHESCLYGWKEGAPHNWYSDRKQTSVIECKKPQASKLHPTMKPVELFEYQIRNSSKPGDIVLDLFGGSGTTLIACEKSNRSARLMELDPKYCDVIRKRYTKWAKENNKPITSGCLE